MAAEEESKLESNFVHHETKYWCSTGLTAEFSGWMLRSVAITLKTEEPAMNKPLSPDEVLSLSMPIPIVEPMTKRAKLQRLAKLARSQSGWWKSSAAFRIYHTLENYTDQDYDSISTGGSVFALANADPVLTEAGYTGTSLGDAKRFFELSREDLHEFSCDCGGAISNRDMADRIEKIARHGPDAATAIVIDSKSWTG